jgi:hypothetical protein
LWPGIKDSTNTGYYGKERIDAEYSATVRVCSLGGILVMPYDVILETGSTLFHATFCVVFAAI